MELNDDFLSLRKFKDDEKKVWPIFDAALKKNITLYAISTASGELKKLYSNSLQSIYSHFPQKAKIMLEEYHDDSKYRHPLVEHYQLVSFSDLWLKNVDFEKLFPEPIGNPLPTPTQSYEVERNTMLKIILGMAIDAYGFDPKEPKNSATGSNKGSIKYALNDAYLTIDEDTVRKYLKEAKEQFPNARSRKMQKA